MRIASILAVERDIKLCTPVHDALLIEARSDQIDSEVVRLKECMSEASQGCCQTNENSHQIAGAA